MNKKEFVNDLSNLGINPTDKQLELLEGYYKELVDYNKHTNLTAIVDEKDVYYKHFYDSLTLTKVIDLNSQESLLDIGSGAGFPGIVLKIFYPNLNITLIDSNNKKTKFLEYIIDKLQLDSINVINDRVENYSKIALNSFDVVTARAVTNLPVLVELSLPLVKENKYFIALKGDASEEIEKSIDAIDIMHGSIDNTIIFDLPYGYGKRTIISIKKNKNTSIDEIRPYDKIIKKPLQKAHK